MPMNTREFRQHGKELVDYICDYVETVDKRRVISNVEPGYLAPLLDKTAPTKGEPWENIVADIEDKIMPGITHWNHPSFHAYFPAGNCYPSILGDMLSSAIGCIGFSWAASPACTELETIVLDWLGKAINLPSQFIYSDPQSKGGGVIEGSASECILVSMLAARKQALLYLKAQHREMRDLEDAMLLPKLVGYTSKEAHSSVEKAALIALVKLRILDTDDNCRLTGETLNKAMKEDIRKGLHPFFVSATLGTTGCTAFDELEDIGKITRSMECCWLHVDGAYAGGGFICPELQPLMKGIEMADSFNTNPNKWLLVNFDCSCLWVRDSSKLTQALVVDPLYLHHAHDKETVDYRHWSIPLSRRFRSLKLWFTLRSYGIEGLQEYIRNHCRLAKEFETLVRQDTRFEVCNQVRLGLVCFRVKVADVKAAVNDRLNQSLLATINASGKLHMIPSLVKGHYIIRFCVVHEHATLDHVESAWAIIKDYATQALDRLKREMSKPTTPIVETPPPPSARTLTRRMSFTRSVSREMYETRCSRNSLYDGATPIVVPEDDGLELPDLAEVEDVFENNFHLDPVTIKVRRPNGVSHNHVDSDPDDQNLLNVPEP